MHHVQMWRNVLIQGCVQPSLDVEVSVQGDDGLDVGVFGSTDRLAEDEAPQVVDGVVQQLLSLALES